MSKLKFLLIAVALFPACQTEPLPPESDAGEMSSRRGASSTSEARQGESCLEGRPCEGDLTCVSFVGFGGNQLATCEIPCENDAACPEAQSCALVADGPGWVCQTTGSESDALPRQGEACPDARCADGLACIEYYGIAGPRGGTFTSCEIRCTKSDGCPSGQQCVTIADGPGEVCRPDPRES
jgi:hypothetical protein